MKITFVIASALVAFPAALFAQTPQALSSDDLVRMLKPTATGPTRGIRALSAPPAAEPLAAVTPLPPTPPPPAETGDLASVPLHVEFQTGSDKLTPAAMKTLDELGAALSNAALASYHFRIEGHTDAVGSAPLNQALSARRAATVAEYIETRFHIDPARLTTAGFGDTQMLVPTAEGVPEPRNRCVQIVNIGTSNKRRVGWA